LYARLDLAIDALRTRRFRVVEGECLRSNVQHVSASREQRAAELMMFLLDPNVAAVMPPWGGEFAIELLPLLDFDALGRVAPKWLTGFSDVSTLQLPLLLCAGWASESARVPWRPVGLSQAGMAACSARCR
jgi:muramoyltetrapeptide carboxypeptidase LdcA involved in peptidoglycan recycling